MVVHSSEWEGTSAHLDALTITITVVYPDLRHGPAVADCAAGRHPGGQHDCHPLPQQPLPHLRRRHAGARGHVHPPLHGESDDSAGQDQRGEVW